ncbi:P-loop NTPase family protein [Aureimonas frigidaquae]|uniref:hypothetical protein n=1 Tax=Aureimonas frigidaquae TaxID=424757 RepID=UPI000781AEB2|nr:hypothetical protein [Aureimonas frigidaquae]
MDRVTEALQRARSASPVAAPSAPAPIASTQRDQRDPRATRAQRVSGLFQVDAGAIAALDVNNDGPAFSLSSHKLLAENVVAFDKADPRTRAFDILRNHMLGLLKADLPQVVAVTAPTRGCGVTTMTANLAFSLARSRKQSAVVIDLRHGTHSLCDTLGLPRVKADDGGALVDRIRRARAGGAVVNLITPPAGVDVVSFVETVKRELRPDILFLDMPPMLEGDEAAPILPLADLVLMVLAVGRTSVQELETCKNFLPSTARMQVVMNKARPHGM